MNINMARMSVACFGEPFSDWLEEKINLPIFEGLPGPECGQNKAVVYSNLEKIHHQDTTQSLLQEFETVMGDVEACHYQISQPVISTLTPPQSPPPQQQQQQQQQQTTIKSVNETHLLVTLQPMQNTFVYPSQQNNNIDHNQQQQSIPIVKSMPYIDQIPEQWNAENLSLEPLGGDVARELAAVDEYVRSCVEDVSPSSPCTSSGASCTSSEESIDDPDWVIDNGNHHNSRKAPSSMLKLRRKPYSKVGVEDKKVRKKEQNKNAATRYRQKKKQEIKEILTEEQQLVKHNDKLQEKVKDLQREIGYLKGLMRDLFKAKGFMK
ncbi:activating transcription factor of chaperone isoform X2 [Leptopilina boulardi]|uniref:activating transcription factor of chaperone isoform X2 n=1 Tax=Leptopilina boulardi TaxID=63433 RepID=UPI0021F60D70|nr:activating transcription factor of chaperone isoform X2 [Leptopilina boulardi]